MMHYIFGMNIKILFPTYYYIPHNTYITDCV